MRRESVIEFFIKCPCTNLIIIFVWSVSYDIWWRINLTKDDDILKRLNFIYVKLFNYTPELEAIVDLNNDVHIRNVVFTFVYLFFEINILNNPKQAFRAKILVFLIYFITKIFWQRTVASKWHQEFGKIIIDKKSTLIKIFNHHQLTCGNFYLDIKLRK